MAAFQIGTNPFQPSATSGLTTPGGPALLAALPPIQLNTLNGKAFYIELGADLTADLPPVAGLPAAGGGLQTGLSFDQKVLAPSYSIGLGSILEQTGCIDPSKFYVSWRVALDSAFVKRDADLAADNTLHPTNPNRAALAQRPEPVYLCSDQLQGVNGGARYFCRFGTEELTTGISSSAFARFDQKLPSSITFQFPCSLDRIPDNGIRYYANSPRIFGTRDLSTGQPMAAPYYENQFISYFNIRFIVSVEISINVKPVYSASFPYDEKVEQDISNAAASKGSEPGAGGSGECCDTGPPTAPTMSQPSFPAVASGGASTASISQGQTTGAQLFSDADQNAYDTIMQNLKTIGVIAAPRAMERGQEIANGFASFAGALAQGVATFGMAYAMMGGITSLAGAAEEAVAAEGGVGSETAAAAGGAVPRTMANMSAADVRSRVANMVQSVQPRTAGLADRVARQLDIPATAGGQWDFAGHARRLVASGYRPERAAAIARGFAGRVSSVVKPVGDFADRMGDTLVGALRGAGVATGDRITRTMRFLDSSYFGAVDVANAELGGLSASEAAAVIPQSAASTLLQRTADAVNSHANILRAGSSQLTREALSELASHEEAFNAIEMDNMSSASTASTVPRAGGRMGATSSASTAGSLLPARPGMLSGRSAGGLQMDGSSADEIAFEAPFPQIRGLEATNASRLMMPPARSIMGTDSDITGGGNWDMMAFSRGAAVRQMPAGSAALEAHTAEIEMMKPSSSGTHDLESTLAAPAPSRVAFSPEDITRAIDRNPTVSQQLATLAPPIPGEADANIRLNPFSNKTFNITSVANRQDSQNTRIFWSALENPGVPVPNVITGRFSAGNRAFTILIRDGIAAAGLPFVPSKMVEALRSVPLGQPYMTGAAARARSAAVLEQYRALF